jgi:flagella basal body P-ring formation protein FlgA
LKTPLIAGRMLTPQMLQADLAIRRGQTVTLAVNNSGVSIRMSGKALMDGALGQRIRVENTNSGRIVEGIVRSREHVEILMPTQRGSFNTQPKVSARIADIGTTNNDR